MLLLEPEARSALWRRLVQIIEEYTEHIDAWRVTAELDPDKIRSMLAPLDFRRSWDPLDALEFAAENLWRYQTHTPHPRYYGLFNPAPTTMGIAADALVAAFNPQLAAWSHSPVAAEIENHLVRAFGVRFGYDPASLDGTFASGGAEANHTAVLAALARSFPEYAQKGVWALRGQPVFYSSVESHHSFVKAARTCGIGSDALHEIAVDSGLRMNPEALQSRIAADRADGLAPFMIVATAGTTNAGVVDPIPKFAEIAQREGLWLHVDAAWGGAAILVDELKYLLDGIALADSITFDAHKWLSTPMGAGLFLTRHPAILTRTFSTPTAYMPREAAHLSVVDPHLHSLQWSRRFIGLKVFLSLLVAGWDGYAAALRRMTAMGDQLRRLLADSGWKIENKTPLPVVCFSHPGGPEPEAIARDIVRSGEAWISTTRMGGKVVLRACITNFRTGDNDVRALVESLNASRLRQGAAHGAAAQA
ncbi:MAG: aminotransferase class V-fold PLP-dependent enzyme [Bryobacteraceae bacterium]|nr:aminotransferase class V-fold PLP-dependent enzyme [Bryobacteraceae bacterium]